MKDNRKPTEVKMENLQHFLIYGPGLSTCYDAFVVARDTTKKRILLGGLGACGVGQMWMGEEERHKDYSGYEEAILGSEDDPLLGILL